MSLLWFSISFLYFSLLILVNQFGFNFFVNGVILYTAELSTTLFSYFSITTLKRKQVLSLAVSLILLCSFILIFISGNKICTSNCWNLFLIFELVLFFVLLFSAGLVIQLLVIYLYELFPVQVAALGMGMTQFSMCVANIIIPSLVVLLNSMNVSVMGAFCVIAVLFLCSIAPLP